MKKIMIYCQHLAGMGHLVRCREIIRSLVDSFDICFVSGGQIVPQFHLPEQIEIVQLPGFYQKGAALVPLDTAMTEEETKTQRKQKLLETFNQFQPDCLITECFPFSKMSMKYELSPLLKQAKASARPVKILCSLRDLIMTQPLSADARERREAKVCRLVNRFYDGILFHSDASFQRLEDCFSRVGDLNCEIIYTGYVAQSPAPESLPTAQDIAGLSDAAPTIVASAGGGRHGYPLLSAIIAASGLIADYFPHQIYVFAGPFMSEADYAQLQQAAAQRPNVTLRRYTCLLLDYLKRAELSISLGGYNTTMNLLRTGVRSLVLPSLNPSQTDEQRIRTEKLASVGVLTLLTPDALATDPLVGAIVTALSQPRTTHHINLHGAAHTAAHIQRLLSASPVSGIASAAV
ncbi:MAG: glycosyltransferase [Cyanobacteria bacterium J06560_6]